jgi:hypothetical protein
MTQTTKPGSAAQGEYREIFAMDPEVGTVYRCNNCGLIHVQVEDVELRTDAEGFHSLVKLLNRAVAQHAMASKTHEGLVC